MTIIDDFVCLNENGLYCKYGDFYLDPILPVKRALISHAHADHAIAGNGIVYATETTLAFMKLRYGKNLAKEQHSIEFETSFLIGKVKIIFFPAGHIFCRSFHLNG